jgi:hypothetical protein
MDDGAQSRFLRWLDVIPGRNWLVLGAPAEEFAGAIRAGYAPSSVTAVESYVEPVPFETGAFDVAVYVSDTGSPELSHIVLEMRRVLWPAGIAGLYLCETSGEVERVFREAGLHAVQSRSLEPRSLAVKGIR